MTTLYKTYKSTTRTWSAEVQANILYLKHGMVGGKLQTDEVVHTDEEDALQDLQSRAAHKIAREGYSANPEAPPPGKPMLLQDFRTYHHKLPEDIFYQPKLDGHRCIGSKYTMVSRNDDLITSMPHIMEELRLLPDDVYLDGEIYLHGVSLQEHSSAIRSHEPVPFHQEYKYVVFDIQNQERYYERRLRLEELFKHHRFQHITLLEALPGKKARAPLYLREFREQGYEGAILRAPNAFYEKDTRSYNVQKVKQILFARFPVVNIVCSDKGREKGLAIVECKAHNGKLFRARIAKPAETRKFIYNNRANSLPAAADIEFSDFTEAGIPQHPRCIQFYKGLNIGKATEVQNRIN